MSSKTLALVLSDNTRNRDNSSFIYHFQNCTALTTQCSATFSVSKMSAAAPLTQVSVTEPLALPWVALGTATPFILGYRVVGDNIVISQAPKYITESLAKTEMYELGVMGTKHVPEALLIQDPSLIIISSISRSNSGEKLSLGEYFSSF
jgi:hypothetical protein